MTELEEQLIDFAGRIQSGCGPHISYDEVQQWPESRLDEFLDMGVLIATTPAKVINCIECKADCPPIAPSIEILPDASEPLGVFLCKKEGGGGLIKIPLERMKRWEIVADKLIELGYYQESQKSNEEANKIKLPEWSQPLFGTAFADIFSVHPHTMRKWLSEGKYSAQKISDRKWRVKISELPAEYVQKVIGQ